MRDRIIRSILERNRYNNRNNDSTAPLNDQPRQETLPWIPRHHRWDEQSLPAPQHLSRGVQYHHRFHTLRCHRQLSSLSPKINKKRPPPSVCPPSLYFPHSSWLFTRLLIRIFWCWLWHRHVSSRCRSMSNLCVWCRVTGRYVWRVSSDAIWYKNRK